MKILIVFFSHTNVLFKRNVNFVHQLYFSNFKMTKRLFLSSPISHSPTNLHIQSFKKCTSKKTRYNPTLKERIKNVLWTKIFLKFWIATSALYTWISSFIHVLTSFTYVDPDVISIPMIYLVWSKLALPSMIVLSSFERHSTGKPLSDNLPIYYLRIWLAILPIFSSHRYYVTIYVCLKKHVFKQLEPTNSMLISSYWNQVTIPVQIYTVLSKSVLYQAFHALPWLFALKISSK